MNGRPPAPTTLSLSRETCWTLHHALLSRLEDGTEPRPELLRTFERVDAGETTFTAAELERIRDVLADYHHATGWPELERARLEELLHRVTEALESPEAEPMR
ncbi:hypothetical protein [Saliphagus infecundisoli]|uniref:Uncharacterized protein n=1 Tax=Saliphagus infecundisoli TaxID=1849069 RepID=A0ABD5QGH7_9EURY|nr:hypothetical protein [Saliphagus infecundisoli]